MNRREEKRYEVLGPGIPRHWVVIGNRPGPRLGGRRPVLHFRLYIKRLLHLHGHKARQTPSKYPVGSWRWFLFDRYVPVRFAGGPSQQGWTPGQIVSWDKFGLDHTFTVMFPRLHRIWWKATYIKFRKCGCSHRLWGRRAVVMSRCDRHDWLHAWSEELRAAMENDDKWVKPEFGPLLRRRVG